MLVVALLLSTTLPAAQATAAIILQPAIGLGDEETEQASSRLLQEVEGAGVVVMGSAPLVDAACAADPLCLERARLSQPLPPAGLIVVELLRIGPVVQLTATATGGGRSIAASMVLNADQLASGPLLPSEVRAWLVSLRPARSAVPPPAASRSPLSLIVVTVGGAAALGGALVVASNELVLEDQKSLGDGKVNAIVAGRLGLAATLVGLALIGTGIGLAASE